MEQQKVTINELVKRLTDEMLRIGYSKQTIYRNFIPNMMHVVHFYEATGTVYYSPASSAEYLSYNIERCKRGEITDHYVRQIRSTISKMDEFFTTGTLRIRSNKHGTTYIISAENERLIDQFIGWKNYGPNTRDDVRWVVRKYLFYLESRGFSFLADVSVDAVKDFILQTASDVKAASLHNILLYLKYFHMFLKENSISAPDCVELFSYKVYREMPIQSYVTDEELSCIFNVIDRDTDAGKRDYAIIQLSATTGLRASDIINIKLSDIDWRKGEIRIKQRKTNREIVIPFKNYMKEFHSGETWESQNYIFYANHHGVMEKICDDTIRVRMNIYAEMARQECSEVPERVHPHLWRHSRAMHLYQHGMDLTLISQWLGHKQFTTTLVYAHADTETKRKAIEKAIGGTSPIEQISQATYKVEDEETLKRLYGLK